MGSCRVCVEGVYRVMRGAWSKEGAGVSGIITADTECEEKCSVT